MATECVNDEVQDRSYLLDQSSSQSLNPEMRDVDGVLERERSEPTMSRSKILGQACIVCHECLHSAAFYILIPSLLYFLQKKNGLDYPGHNVVTFTLVFTGVSFVLPLIGGVIGDTILGRYKAVLYGTCIELLGMVLLLIYTGIQYSSESGPITPGGQLSFIIVSLVIIALGMGFIKANINPFGAEQLKERNVAVNRIQSYFRWYNFSINLGRLIAFLPVSFLLKYTSHRNGSCKASQIHDASMTSTPILHNGSKCCPSSTSHQEAENDFVQAPIVAAVIQVVFTAMAIVIFVMGKPNYTMSKPSGSKQMKHLFFWHRRRKRLGSTASILQDRTYTRYIQSLETYERRIFRTTIMLAALFAMFIVYEAIYFQLISSFMLQAECLQEDDTFKFPLPFMNTFSTCIIVFSVPVLECCFKKPSVDQDTIVRADIDGSNIYCDDNDGEVGDQSMPRDRSIETSTSEVQESNSRKLERENAARNRRETLLLRMCIGMGFAAVTAICAGMVEAERQNYQVSIFWQAPQYILMGIAEIFAVMSAFEFAFTESFPGVQGFTTGMFVGSYGLGSFLGLILFAAAAAPCRDGNDCNLTYFYIGLGGAMLLIMMVFIILSRLYLWKHAVRPREPLRPFSSDPTEE